ncbi:MAG: hypothetical protein ACREJB_14285, partial [Planctomycetaceae bacterium]
LGPPVGYALAEYGDAMVPSVVHAYLDRREGDFSQETQQREFAFFAAITEKVQTIKTAQTYIKGIASETSSPAKKRRIEYFLKRTNNALEQQHRIRVEDEDE